MDKPRVRFAPSPTGSLHVGGARTAIYNWAFARNTGGMFILRIEDTDVERSTPENTAQIIRSLTWLGLNWDEGPEVGGDFGPYLQSERTHRYVYWLDRLRERDAAYPCFCTAEELKDRRQKTAEAFASGSSEAVISGYDRRCRQLSADEVNSRLAAGEQHTWRLKLPLEHSPVVFDDAVFGVINTPFQQLDDFILVRSDGTPTYNYACVADDLDMKITHVIRGDDHVSNTPKQLLIYEALGELAPAFAHLPMIHGADGSKLSKRHGAASVEEYRDSGYLTEALVNYLALLGWSLDGETTLIDPEMLCRNFNLGRVSRNPAVFDAAKLDWINAAYIKQMGAEAFSAAVGVWLQNSGLPDEQQAALAGSATTIYPLVAERIKKLSELVPLTAYLFSGANVDLDEKSVESCLRVEGISSALALVIQELSDEGLSWDHASIEAALRALVEQSGMKTKTLFQAVRVAICGNMVSPPLSESIELIGRANSLARLEAAKAIAHQ